jgi:hypothetical protein
MPGNVLSGSKVIFGDGKAGPAMDAANNISLPEPLPAEIQIAAQAEHRTIDEVLTGAVKRYVEERFLDEATWLWRGARKDARR